MQQYDTLLQVAVTTTKTLCESLARQASGGLTQRYEIGLKWHKNMKLNITLLIPGLTQA